MSTLHIATFSSVYGPVQSWRYGRSLGVDPIGPISTCSFNCVYCQLGSIEQLSESRRVFIATDQIQQDLELFAPWDVDVITLSGSGEPTLALNLEEIVPMIKTVTGKPIAVLTNGSLLNDPTVCRDLALADYVAIKVDAVCADQFRRINRPVSEQHLFQLWEGLAQFRQQYAGSLAIQTMILAPWSEREQMDYIQLMQQLAPQEIQLNTPTRPRPLTRQIDARGNHEVGERGYPVQALKPVSWEVLKSFGDRIQKKTRIPVRIAPIPA